MRIIKMEIQLKKGNKIKINKKICTKFNKYHFFKKIIIKFIKYINID